MGTACADSGSVLSLEFAHFSGTVWGQFVLCSYVLPPITDIVLLAHVYCLLDFDFYEVLLFYVLASLGLGKLFQGAWFA